jgi:hypothetical protein
MTNPIINPSDGTVKLRGIEVSLEDPVAQTAIVDMCRHIEGTLDAEHLRAKYLLTDEIWAGLADNNPLQLRIGAELARRVRSGDCSREKAARLLVDAIDTVGEIVRNPANSPKHRLDGARELRAAATSGAETSTPATERDRITIRIDLSAGGNRDNVIIRTFDAPLTHDEENPKTIELKRDENKPLELIEPAHDETEDDGYEWEYEPV